MINGMEMRKATGNYRINDPQDIPRTVIMARTTEKVNSTDHGNRNPRSGKRGVNHEDRRASQVVSKRNPCDMLKKTTIQPEIQLKAHK